VNQQGLATRVSALAARTGHAVPPITWVHGGEQIPGLWLEPPGPIGPMVFVRYRINELLPDFVQDYLIAEEFVQASLGVQQHRERIARVVYWLSMGLVAVLVYVIYRSTDEFWIFAAAFGLACSALLWIVRTAVHSIAWRSFMRRTDRGVTEILGREHALEAMRWYAAQPPRPDLWWNTPDWRWLNCWAPPTAKTRLRTITSVPD